MMIRRLGTPALVLLLGLCVGSLLTACADQTAVGPASEVGSLRLDVSFDHAGPGSSAVAALRFGTASTVIATAPALLQGELRFDPRRLRLVRHEPEAGATLAFDVRRAASGRLEFLALNEEGLSGRLGVFIFEVVGGAGQPDLYLEVDRAAGVDGSRVAVRSLGTRVRAAGSLTAPNSTALGRSALDGLDGSPLAAATGVVGDCSPNGAIDFDDVFAVVDLAVRAVVPPAPGTEAFTRCNPFVDAVIDYRDVAWTARAWMIVAAGFDPWDPPDAPGGSVGAWYVEHWNHPDLPTAYASGTLASAGNDGSKQLLRGLAVPNGDSLAIRMRYNGASARADQHVGVTVTPRDIDRLRPREFWLEVWVRFSDDWNTVAGPASARAPDYAFVRVDDDRGAPGGRWESMIGSGGDALRLLRGGQAGATGGASGSFPGGIGALWDGEWHRLRYHASMGSPGVPGAWWLKIDDHPAMHIGTGVDLDPGSGRYFREWTLSGELARGAPWDMWVDVAPARFYLADPGWAQEPGDPGGGGGAWYVQDWNYPNTTAMLAAPEVGNTSYAPASVSLITDAGGPGFDRAVRASFPAHGGGEAQAGVDLFLPRAAQDRPREIWFEYHARFSSNWQTVGPYPGSAGHKHLFLFDQEQTSAGRWEHIAGLWGDAMSMQIAGNLGPGGRQTSFQPSIRSLWDGNWHRFRCHARMHASDGIWECEVDGQVFAWGRGDTDRGPAYHFSVLSLSRNMNRGVAQTQVLDFGPVRIWTNDPGW